MMELLLVRMNANIKEHMQEMNANLKSNQKKKKKKSGDQ
jgi:hypothetical protein